MDEASFSSPLFLYSICNVVLSFSGLSLKPYIGEGITLGLKGLVPLVSMGTFFGLIIRFHFYFGSMKWDIDFLTFDLFLSMKDVFLFLDHHQE